MIPKTAYGKWQIKIKAEIPSGGLTKVLIYTRNGGDRESYAGTN